MSTKEDRSTLMTKIRHLLSKTEEAGCSAAEAEAALKKATRMMAEHNLKMADVEEHGEPEYLTDVVVDVNKWTIEHQLTYNIVREFWFVECVFSQRPNPNGGAHIRCLKMFGAPENVEAGKWAYQSLMAAYQRLWLDYRVRVGAPASDRRSYIAGVAMGFVQKMRDERAAMEIEQDIIDGRKSGGTGIVLASAVERMQLAFEQAHPGKASTGRYADVSHSVVEDGKRDGRALSLSKGIGATSARRSIAS